AVADRGDGNEPDAEAARVVDEVLELDRLPRPRQRHDDVIGRDHAEIAMTGFAGVHEEGGRAGGGEGCRDFPSDMPGFAHAGHDQPAAYDGDQMPRVNEGTSKAVMNRGRNRVDAGRLALERSHRRGDELAAAGARSSLRAQRLGHDGSDSTEAGRRRLAARPSGLYH